MVPGVLRERKQNEGQVRDTACKVTAVTKKGSSEVFHEE